MLLPNKSTRLVGKADSALCLITAIGSLTYRSPRPYLSTVSTTEIVSSPSSEYELDSGGATAFTWLKIGGLSGMAIRNLLLPQHDIKMTITCEAILWLSICRKPGLWGCGAREISSR